MRLVVVGAGPAGAAAVAEARALGQDVRWYDAGAPRGSWAECVPYPCEGISCMGYRSLWGSDRVEERDTLSNLYGSGFLVDRAAFDAELVAATGVQPLTPTVGDAGAGAPAAFMIDATGRAGGPARRWGGGRVHIDRQVAVQLHMPAGDDVDAMVTTEAVADGWWYSLRSATGRTVGFVTDPALPVFARVRAAFEQHRQKTRLIKWPVAGEPEVRLAGVSRLERFAGPGWAAVGDAAMALDPLGSRGVWMAVESGKRAAQVAAGRMTWEEYARWMERQFFSYLAEREALYAVEQRWTDAPYWQRRRPE